MNVKIERGSNFDLDNESRFLMYSSSTNLAVAGQPPHVNSNYFPQQRAPYTAAVQTRWVEMKAYFAFVTYDQPFSSYPHDDWGHAIVKLCYISITMQHLIINGRKVTSWNCFDSNCAQTRFEIIFFCLCSIIIDMVYSVFSIKLESCFMVQAFVPLGYCCLSCLTATKHSFAFQ